MNCVQKNRLACLIVLAASFFPFAYGSSGQLTVYQVVSAAVDKSKAEQAYLIENDLFASMTIATATGVFLLVGSCLVMNLRPFPFLIALGMASMLYQLWSTVNATPESSAILTSLGTGPGFGLGFWGIALGLSMLILPIQTRPVTSRPIPVQAADPHSYRGSF